MQDLHSFIGTLRRLPVPASGYSMGYAHIFIRYLYCWKMGYLLLNGEDAHCFFKPHLTAI